MTTPDEDLESADGMLRYVRNQTASIVAAALSEIETLTMIVDGFHAECPAELQLTPDDYAPLLALRVNLLRTQRSLAPAKKRNGKESRS